MAKKITLGKIDYLSAVNHLLKMIFYSLNCNKDLLSDMYITTYSFFIFFKEQIKNMLWIRH